MQTSVDAPSRCSKVSLTSGGRKRRLAAAAAAEAESNLLEVLTLQGVPVCSVIQSLSVLSVLLCSSKRPQFQSVASGLRKGENWKSILSITVFQRLRRGKLV